MSGVRYKVVYEDGNEIKVLKAQDVDLENDPIFALLKDRFSNLHRINKGKIIRISPYGEWSNGSGSV